MDYLNATDGAALEGPDGEALARCGLGPASQLAETLFHVCVLWGCADPVEVMQELNELLLARAKLARSRPM